MRTKDSRSENNKKRKKKKKKKKKKRRRKKRKTNIEKILSKKNKRLPIHEKCYKFAPLTVVQLKSNINFEIT